VVAAKGLHHHHVVVVLHLLQVNSHHVGQEDGVVGDGYGSLLDLPGQVPTSIKGWGLVELVDGRLDTKHVGVLSLARGEGGQ
jgi:hypothetical protein